MRRLTKWAKAFRRRFRAAGLILIYIGAASIFIMMLVTAIDLATRAVGVPILGVPELTLIMLVIVAFLGMAYVMAQDRHVSVDILSSHFSFRMRHISHCVNSVIILVFFALLVWQLAEGSISVWQIWERTAILRIPMAPLWFAAVIGSFIMCIEVLIQLIESAAQLIRGDETASLE